MEKEKLMTLEEVRQYLNLGRSQIYQMARDGELPTIKISERGLRVKLSDLDTWIESKKINKLN